MSRRNAGRLDIEASSAMIDYGRKNAGHGRITLAV